MKTPIQLNLDSHTEKSKRLFIRKYYEIEFGNKSGIRPPNFEQI